MKYFSKYLPVEGEIKQGEIIACYGADGEGPVSYLKYTGEELGIQKVKLFLCTNDIQVDDKTGKEAEEYFIKNNTSYITGKQNLDIKFDFKVVGEISPQATWVKEGDEFDEEDVKIWKSAEAYSSKLISEMLGKTWNDVRDAILKEGNVEKIEIKCPCCKTFK